MDDDVQPLIMVLRLESEHNEGIQNAGNRNIFTIHFKHWNKLCHIVTEKVLFICHTEK